MTSAHAHRLLRRLVADPRAVRLQRRLPRLTEEEVVYPVAILVGQLVRQRLGAAAAVQA